MNLNQRIEAWFIENSSAFARSANAKTRPFVTLCYAQSLDGSIALRAGEAFRLSSNESTRLTHQLRSLHDGILVGIGTVLADDPQLTVREWSGKHPQPIVLDSQLRLPPTARVCSASGKRCWVLTAQEAIARDTLDCEFLRVACNGSGQVSLVAALQCLRERGIQHLMVEGGAGVLSALLREHLVDALVLTIAPKIIGGYKALGDLGFACESMLPTLVAPQSEQLGSDIIVWGTVMNNASAA